MAKGKKALTTEELWRERQEKEASERDAYLPPGLVNHGNTCFMNSTLQGLIATRFLYDLFHSAPVPAFGASPILVRRSPLLTNGHGIGGADEREWESGMALGDVFFSVMQRAWAVQDARRRQSMSPKEILTAIGKKFDQYLDFRQQDAHEFLRQLLDAMRMEEHDLIKKRQPPPPKERRSRGKRKPPPQPSPDAEPGLSSFADMIFGGRLASILVCEKCKHVSHTYEDFNDLSLSIKPEDYAREKKRDRLKQFAKRFKFRAAPAASGPGSGSGSGSVPLALTMPSLGGVSPAEIVRPSSVPPTPGYMANDGKEPDGYLTARDVDGSRRRSIDATPGPHASQTSLKLDSPPPAPPSADNATPTPAPPSADNSTPTPEPVVLPPAPSTTQSPASRPRPLPTPPAASASTTPTAPVPASATPPSNPELKLEPLRSREHVEFIEGAKPERKDKDKEKKDDDAWSRLGRRLSMTVGMGKGRSNKSRSRERGAKADATRPSGEELLSPGTSVTSDANTITPGTTSSHSTPPARRDASTERKQLSAPTPAAPAGPPAPDPAPALPPTLAPDESGRARTVSAPQIAPNPEAPPPLVPEENGLCRASTGASHKRPGKAQRPPKPSRTESEYIRRILSDVPSAPSTNPLALLLSSAPAGLAGAASNFAGAAVTAMGQGHSAATAAAGGAPVAGRGQNWWAKLSQLTTVDECLRMFTSVEVLEGENMVGCRRCWKIEHGTYQPKPPEDGDEGSESDEEDGEAEVRGVDSERDHAIDLGKPIQASPMPMSPDLGASSAASTAPSSLNLGDGVSDSSATTGSSSSDTKAVPPALSTTAEVSKAPMASYGGIPIPSISTTAPDSPLSPLPTVHPVVHSLSNGSLSAPGPTEGHGHNHSRHSSGHSPGTSDAEDGAESDESASTYTYSASSSTPPSASVSAENLTPAPLSSSPASPASTSRPTRSPKPNGIPRSQQVVLRRCYKRYLIAQPPPILVIHLKRFQQTTKMPVASAFSGGFKKLDDFVAFPEYLDLAPYLEPKKEAVGKRKGREQTDEDGKRKEETCQYRLYAVVQHIGNMLGGHYVAHVALPSAGDVAKRASTDATNADVTPVAVTANGTSTEATVPTSTLLVTSPRQWAYISDTVVRPTTLEDVLKVKAYLCMYERIP